MTATKINREQLENCIDGIELANFMNDTEYNTEKLKYALNHLSASLESLIKTEYSGLVEQIQIKPKLVDMGKDTQCWLLFIFNIQGTKEKFKYDILKKGYDKFFQDIANLIQLMTYGMRVVNELNKTVSRVQAEKGSYLFIQYRWGISDRYCKIVDWDFDRIKIKLTAQSIIHLIDLYNEDELESVVRETNWNITIKKLVSDFDKMTLHNRINASIGHESLTVILTEFMLNTDDVLAVIKKNKDEIGIQELSSVSIIKELGKFIAIAKWSVDYTQKKISISLTGNKVYDIENDRFIADRDIVNRVESRIALSKETLNMLFG